METLFYPYRRLAEIDESSQSLLLLANFVKKQATFQYVFVDFGEIDGEQAAIIDININIPQLSKVGLREIERLAIIVSDAWDKRPRVLALRKDFPLLPHQIMTPANSPRELCLFDIDYRDALSNKTPAYLAAIARAWLNRAATNTLHLIDQPIEPFIPVNTFLRIVLDNETHEALIKEDSRELFLNFGYFRDDAGLYVEASIRDKVIPIEGINRKRPRYHCLALTTKPSSELIINQFPDDFYTLNQLFRKCDLDILGHLNAKIREWIANEQLSELASKELLLLIKVPRIREKSTAIETVEWLGFLLNCTIGSIGMAFDLIAKQGNTYAGIIGSKCPNAAGLQNIKVACCSVVLPVNKQNAMAMSGISNDLKVKSITAIGAGALGSTIILNLARQGIGNWNVIDEDILLPHNFVRHQLSRLYAGTPKAWAVINEINMLFDDSDSKHFLKMNIHGGTDDDKKLLSSYLSEADLVIDASASFGILKTLAANSTIKSRIVSAYVSNFGEASVVLLESQDRNVRIDDLDVELKVLSLYDQSFRRAFDKTNFQSVNYAGGCSSQSAVIPQEHVALHGAQIARYIKASFGRDWGEILITNLDKDGYTIESKAHKSSGISLVKNGGWEFRISNFAKNKMVVYRKAKLPNETGGILVGTFDFYQRIVYIGDVFPSPVDSEEWPTSYIRGYKNLRNEVERISQITNGDLHYIGEWHSHPDNCTVEMSEDDKKALTWIRENAGADGLPGVMLIAGENSTVGCYAEAAWERI
ncbi:ThiF family adenylyltransferase [bacterium]|nr:ThiF family adenylyltransferase [bacterium]